jgi:DNA-binding NarL/FixJ family response regulator
MNKQLDFPFLPKEQKRRRWTEQEEDILRRIYASNDNRTIAENMGRSISSIRTKAKALGLEKTTKS